MFSEVFLDLDLNLESEETLFKAKNMSTISTKAFRTKTYQDIDELLVKKRITTMNDGRLLQAVLSLMKYEKILSLMLAAVEAALDVLQLSNLHKTN